MKPRLITLLFIFAALAGVIFSGVSAFDFIQHLDRELHGIHCSVIPGMGTPDSSGASGCSVALMSPWSSVFRQSIWGGIPVALPGMSVYTFLLFLGLDLWVNRREGSRQATLFLVLASTLPVVSSLVMGIISYTQLHSFCKVCVGMYVSSVLMFVFALWAWRRAVRPSLADSQQNEEAAGLGAFALPVVEGVLFVLVPLVLYVALVPDASAFVGKCGSLVKAEDPYNVLVSLDKNTSGRSVIEVMDPLCPSCRAFERRFTASGLEEKVHRQALLFPLDNTCNWMVSSAVHPGACDLSEAVLCAEDRAPDVIAWSFQEQEKIREAAAASPDAVKSMIFARFPELKSCVGSPTVKARINRSMRWAVANQLPLLMPQLFVDGVKLCDQDTDLGMDYSLSRLLDPVFVKAAGIETLPGAGKPSSESTRPPEKTPPARPATPRAKAPEAIPTGAAIPTAVPAAEPSDKKSPSNKEKK